MKEKDEKPKKNVIPIESLRRKKLSAESPVLRAMMGDVKERYNEWKKEKQKQEREGAKAKIVVSDSMKATAMRAFEAGQIIKKHDRFEIFALPTDSEFADQFVLLLWREGDDFSEVPIATVFYPVTIGNREGYLWQRELAIGYKPWEWE